MNYVVWFCHLLSVSILISGYLKQNHLVHSTSCTQTLTRIQIKAYYFTFIYSFLIRNGLWLFDHRHKQSFELYKKMRLICDVILFFCHAACDSTLIRLHLCIVGPSVYMSLHCSFFFLSLFTMAVVISDHIVIIPFDVHADISSMGIGALRKDHCDFQNSMKMDTFSIVIEYI